MPSLKVMTISLAHYDPGVAVVAGHFTVVHTGSGDLRGTAEGGVEVWRGVPYAQQPVGERRFLAPAALQPWTGVRDALEHGPLPPQGKSFVGGGRDDPKVRDEACLTLTVWSPDVNGALPVMVWIPGGAFVYGAGQFQLYNGSRLAANGNVVVVNVTYRIGVFGGFELSDLGDGFDDNLALRDQMAALRWVKENISAFGGDPDRVIVFGESAGATSVLALLASPSAGPGRHTSSCSIWASAPPASRTYRSASCATQRAGFRSRAPRGPRPLPTG
jgi:para-nitrobenzyl esterase